MENETAKNEEAASELHEAIQKYINAVRGDSGPAVLVNFALITESKTVSGLVSNSSFYVDQYSEGISMASALGLNRMMSVRLDRLAGEQIDW